MVMGIIDSALERSIAALAEGVTIVEESRENWT